MVRTVHLTDKASVERLNAVASVQPFDMSVSCGTTMIDARSLLALFSLVGKDVHLVVPDDLPPKRFDRVVRQMKLS